MTVRLTADPMSSGRLQGRGAQCDIIRFNRKNDWFLLGNCRLARHVAVSA
jgi:hypothetical protein